MLFWFLFHTTILLYLHFCSWELCHPLPYSLNSYFFNLFLILICALTFFCNKLFFFCRSRRMLPNHRSSWITFHQSYYWDLFVSKNWNFWTVSKENDDFIDIFVWLRHPSFGFMHWDHRKTTNRTDTQSNIVPIPGRDETYQHCNNQGVPPKMQVHFNKCLPPRMQGPFLVC